MKYMFIGLGVCRSCGSASLTHYYITYPLTNSHPTTALGERAAASPLVERAVGATLEVLKGEENVEGRDGDVATGPVESDSGGWVGGLVFML